MNVTSRPLLPGRSLPLLVEPADEASRGIDALVAWLGRERAWLDEALVRHNAVLLRGFAIDGPPAFERAVAAVDPELLDYVEGAARRTRVPGTERVYNTTDFHPELFFAFHNELSYAGAWPAKLYFFCRVAPEEQGETPLADSRAVLADIPAEVRARFEARKVQYIRRLPRVAAGYFRTWPETFETDDPERVEEHCRARGIDFEWKGDTLVVRERREAVITHPRSGETVWFNQADAYHASWLPSTIRDGLERSPVMAIARQRRVRVDLNVELAVPPDERARDCVYGDGSEIDLESIEAIRRAYTKNAVSFPWRRGDLLIVDNVMTAHARSPFRGSREILVAMTGRLPR